MKSPCIPKVRLACLLTGVWLLVLAQAAWTDSGNLEKGFPRHHHHHHRFNGTDRSDRDYFQNGANLVGSQNSTRTRNTSYGGNTIGSSPGSIMITINGNGNTVYINGNTGSAKSAHHGHPHHRGIAAKNGGTAPLNSPLTKPAGKSNSGSQNVGSAKSARTTLNAPPNNSGNVKNAGNAGARHITKNTANTQKSPGARVGTKTQVMSTTTSYTSIRQTQKTSNNLKGPGVRVGNKMQGKNATTGQQAKKASSNSRGPGAQVGKNAQGKNRGCAKAGAPSSGMTKHAGKNSTGPAANRALAKNAGNTKSATPTRGMAKNAGRSSNTPTANKTAAKQSGAARGGPQTSSTARNAGRGNNASAAHHSMIKHANQVHHSNTSASKGAFKTGATQHRIASRSPVQARPVSHQAINRGHQQVAHHQSPIQRGVVHAHSTGRRK